ncbi:bacterial regulatory protein, tetR family [Anaerotignum neopropionicum]|uniref:Bacterial regulatory protein, tetR family n=1 Tax=Anaerotignum neopropionicum TaxID=36847 RepID=A0A136WDP6_9FIRM|nr:TetR-like C-terminal domain-containing protein [Anaerotignum neopropionicum]KXL52642.1 bacterial regulatory protein, tetR family [Anaerotignum neopropionicum]
MSLFTKKAIHEVFLNLLFKKSFDKITVKDIVEECGINRNTFYYYYKDIYDLLEDVLLTETKKVLEDQQSSHTCYEEFLRIAAFITSYKTSISHIFYSKSRDVFVSYLYDISEIILQNYIDHLKVSINISEQNKKFVCDFYRFSLVGMIINWIKNGMEEDSLIFLKKMSDIFENTVEIALQFNQTENKNQTISE